MKLTEKFLEYKYIMQQILFILFAFSLANAEFTYENDVVILSESNFEEALDQFEYIFLDFYASWCEACKEFLPHYETLAKDLKEEGIVLAKVDAIENRKLADA